MPTALKRIPPFLSAALVVLLAAATLAGAAPVGGASAPGAATTPAPSATTHTSHPATGAPVRRSASPAVSVTDARCVPSNSCGSDPHTVSLRGRLAFTGRGLHTGMLVSFPRTPGGRPDARGWLSRLHASATLGLLAAVPARAHSGRVAVLIGRGRFSNAFGPIRLVRRALHPPTPVAAQGGAAAVGPSPFDGQGMWIWYLSKSDGGSIPAIVAQARQAGISTVYLKSSDGSTNAWPQFSAANVSALKAGGLHVCAWQYVYGTYPTQEAALGVQAVQAGADCLVIDAESEYEGRYAAAQAYLSALRSSVGPDFPVGLASFPYVDYHPQFPYSVFLGPGGAQFNLPQMYWKDIGTSVDNVYSHTYTYNRIYGRAVYPLGQTYSSPSAADLMRFRELASAYGATGLSWWDWQETTASEWTTLAAPLTAPTGFAGPASTVPVLASGAKGDDVLWMQEHLATASPSQPTTGVFDATTQQNLAAFQQAHGIPPSGTTDAATWQALLALPPVAVSWGATSPAG